MAQQTLQAIVRHNVFYVHENQKWEPYLEMYFDIDPHTLLFEKRADSFRAKIRVDIELKNGNGITVNRENYFLETNPVSKAIETYLVRITDLRRLAINTGETKICIKFTDQFNKNYPFIQNENINIEVPNNYPFFSDIQLVDTNIAASDESIYQRNLHLQIPLASDFFDERKKLNYYTELYQPDSINSKGYLVLKTYVSKKESDVPIYQLSKIDTINKKTIYINEGSFNIAILPSGNYFLKMDIEDSTNNKFDSKSLFFQVMNKEPEKFEAVIDTDKQEENIVYFDIGKTFAAKYTTTQIRAILKMLQPISDATERKRIADFLQSYDDMYARYFIYNFWLSRDKKEPEKSWKEYAEKVKVVNRLYGSNSMPGYESDRGIIQLKYGVPDDRIQVNNEEGALPYEIWQFNALPKNGNALFLFYRAGNGLSNFELLHSTIIGERRNLQWRSLLYLQGVNNNNIGSKAEFYLGNR